MTELLEQLPWAQPLLLILLLIGGLALRRWGNGRARMIGMAVLWSAVLIAVAWFAWSLTQALRLIQPG